MKQPVILISSGRFVDTLSMQRRQSELYAACLAAVNAAGVLYCGDMADILAARCDGLLLAGGGDLHPARYGQSPCANVILSIDEVRDAEEQALFNAFFTRGKPILGVCRGMQAINVFLGGTLHQHTEGHMDCCHSVRCFGLLQAMLGTSQTVNSFHHQTVDRVAERLSVAACAPDGTIEALVHPTAPILGVQWHPERLVPGICTDVAETDHLPLFRWLCQQC